MQGHEEVRPIGDYCEITNRILVISPRPASLRALVAELAVKCYDVLLLHHVDDPLLNMVPGSIVVLDRTADAIIPSPLSTLRYDTGPVLSLVSPNSANDGQNSPMLEWPCPIDHVIAMIQELASQLNPIATGSHLLSFRDIQLDTQRMSVTQSGTRVILTKTEYDLLRSLITAQGKVMSRQELMTEVWGEQYFGGSNAVDVHIRSLRHKLSDDPKESRYIATVRGAGYRLADV